MQPTAHNTEKKKIKTTTKKNTMRLRRNSMLALHFTLTKFVSSSHKIPQQPETKP